MDKKSAEYSAKFGECYKRFASPLTRFISCHIGNWDTAEEIMQEMFTSLYEKNCPLDISVPSTAAFLYKVARNRIIDHRRKKLIAIPSSGVLEEIIADDSLSSRVSDCCLEGEVTGTLYQVLSALPETGRQAVILNFCRGKGVRQIGRRLNMSEYKVNLVIREARMKLQESLAKYFTND